MTESSKARYLPAVDGLRAFSVAAVIAYHLGHLKGGFLGVDVFFSISGFLITRLLLSEVRTSGRVDLGQFWARRMRRLMPTLMVVASATLILSRLWLPEWRMRSIRFDALGALAYIANWRFVLSGQSYFASGIVPSPFRHTWSLAIEEQYYWLWPLAVFATAILAARTGRSLRVAVGAVAALGAVASALWMVALSDSGNLSRVYFGTDTRAFGLLIGATLACWWNPKTHLISFHAQHRWAMASSVLGFGALALIMWQFVVASSENANFYRGGFQAIALLSMVLVACASVNEGPFSTVLGWSPLVWLGRRSYAMYLWSWPTQILLGERFRLGGAKLAIAVVLLTVGLSALSHVLVEEPLRRAKPTKGTMLRWTGAVSGVVVLSIAVAIGTPPAPAYTTVSDDQALADALAPVPGNSPRPNGPSTTIAPTIDGPMATPALVPFEAQVDPLSIHDRPLRVMIAGDSIGWSLGYQLPDHMTTSVELQVRTIIACSLLPADGQYLVGNTPNPYSDQCVKAKEAEEVGLAGHPDVVLLWTGAWEVFDQQVDGETLNVGSDEYATALEAALQEKVDRFRSVGVPTVIPLVPCFGPNAVWLGDERHQADRAIWVSERIRAVAQRNPGWVRVIDPTPLLCGPNREFLDKTPTGIGLREDGSHFSPDAAAWFWNTWLAGQLGAALSP
ncbi:MAG: acyltransferase family protein [Acidimicrobiales bacterium]|nr:acyltransferase family protein [Acidimicrobiales bacterium]